MSRFDCVDDGQPLEFFQLLDAHQSDRSPDKVNLIIGVYRTNNGQPWILPVVQSAELAIIADSANNHEYLGLLGDRQFTKLSTKLLLGENSRAIQENRTFGCQGLSGTGCLRLGADFLSKKCGFKLLYITDPAYDNHRLIFTSAGFDVRSYRYYDTGNRRLDFDGLIHDLSRAPVDSVVVLHACAHNPTGMDPTRDQWTQIADLMSERRLFPLFDCAYQGFASGNPDTDAWSVRYFADRGFELLCAQSFAKNFGLYGERIGNLTVVLNSSQNINKLQSQLSLIVRANYSSPSMHGSKIVSKILSDPKLTEEWHDCIQTMSARILNVRQLLREKLEQLKTPGNWSHITEQIGMFSYSGLTGDQVLRLRHKFHIYMPRNGRISLSGLTTDNVDYVAKAINNVIVNQ